MKRSLFVLALALLLAGCGKHYWEARDSTRGLSAFIEDSGNCAGEAKMAKYGVGAEEIYRACMKAHGWRRVQTPDPTNAQFRGPEDADEFASPPPPLSARGAGPRRQDDPTCVGPTTSRPSHCR
jgi:hypothetical protein